MRIERTTCSLGGSRSIRLSYESNRAYNKAAKARDFKMKNDIFPSFGRSFLCGRLAGVPPRYYINSRKRRPGGGMADAADLKSASFGSTGSIPVPGTIFIIKVLRIKSQRFSFRWIRPCFTRSAPIFLRIPCTTRSHFLNSAQKPAGRGGAMGPGGGRHHKPEYCM